jgi:hypothetical protein
LHTNIGSERTYRGLGAYSWTQTPTQHSNKVLSVDFTDMRTALDQAHTANVCTTVRITHYVTHQSTYNTTHNVAYNSTYKGTYYNSGS